MLVAIMNKREQTECRVRSEDRLEVMLACLSRHVGVFEDRLTAVFPKLSLKASGVTASAQVSTICRFENASMHMTIGAVCRRGLFRGCYISQQVEAHKMADDFQCEPWKKKRRDELFQETLHTTIGRWDNILGSWRGHEAPAPFLPRISSTRTKATSYKCCRTFW